MANPKVIIVTGCTSGIGLHMACAFAKQGHKVVATARNLERLQIIAANASWDPNQVLLEQLDIRSPVAWQHTIDRAIERWGRVDVLLNNAGYLKPGYIHELDPSEIDAHLDTNVKGTIMGSQVTAKQMVKQGSGHIINIASLAGIAPVPGLALYATSKFAVRGFSLSIADELKPYGVSVTVLCPDAVETPMLEMERDYEETALVFSGGKILSVIDIENAIINRAMKRKPLEIALPGTRGFLAKLSSFLPEISSKAIGQLKKKGLKNQRRQ